MAQGLFASSIPPPPSPFPLPSLHRGSLGLCSLARTPYGAFGAPQRPVGLARGTALGSRAAIVTVPVWQQRRQQRATLPVAAAAAAVVSFF